MSSPPHRQNPRVRTVTESAARRATRDASRQNPRARLASAVSQSPSSFSARKRAITISGGGLSAPLSPAGNNDPALLELKSGLLLNVGSVLEEFADLQRDIQSFCSKTASYLSRNKASPRFSPDAAVPGNHPVTKPASDFSKVEEFIYFVSLSIMNMRLYNDIFLPFYPFANADENQRREQEYRNVIDKELQLQAAAWRAKTYKMIDDRVADGARNALLDKILNSIIEELDAALQDLPGEFALSREFGKELKNLLTRACDWNRSIKVDILKYDFEVFVVEPSSPWDPLQMESFERMRKPVSPGASVVSPFALGLIGSISLPNERVSHVQKKALVLVDEWFTGGARGRTISVVPPAYNPSRQQSAISYPPKPIPVLPPAPVGTITTQPQATAPMSISAVRNTSNQTPPPPQQKKGCCG